MEFLILLWKLHTLDYLTFVSVFDKDLAIKKCVKYYLSVQKELYCKF